MLHIIGARAILRFQTALMPLIRDIEGSKFFALFLCLAGHIAFVKKFWGKKFFFFEKGKKRRKKR